jgi:hypothetical protein
MYAVKYIATYESYSSKKWTVEILDRELEFDENIPITIGQAPIITMNGDSMNINTRILTSNCTFSIIINEEDTGIESGLEDYFKFSDEKRLAVRISQGAGASTLPYFLGYIITDGIQIPDEYYPYPIELTAIDLIKGLEGSSYYNGFRSRCSTHLVNVLAGENFENFDLFGTGDYLMMISEWVESEQGGTFNQNLFHSLHFKWEIGKYLQDGTFEPEDRLESLRQVLEMLDARLYMRLGHFVIEQINTAARTSANFYIMDKFTNVIFEGVQARQSLPINSIPLDSSQTRWMNRPMKQYLPPIKKVTQRQKYSAGENLITAITDEYASGEAYRDEVNLGFVYVTEGIPNVWILWNWKFNLICTRLNASGFQPRIRQHYVIFEGQIRVGDKYLKQTEGTTGGNVTYAGYEWSDDPETFEIEILMPAQRNINPDLTSATTKAEWKAKSILTALVPESGILRYYFKPIRVEFQGGQENYNLLAPTFSREFGTYLIAEDPDYFWRMTFKGFMTLVATDDDGEDLNILGDNGIRIVSDTNDFRSTKLYDETFTLSEGPVTNANTMYIYSTTELAEVPTGYDWGIGTPSGLTLHQLAVNEILNRNRLPLQAIFGTVINRLYFDPYFTRTYKGVKYIVNRSVYDTEKDEATLELLEIAYDFEEFQGLEVFDVNVGTDIVDVGRTNLDEDNIYIPFGGRGEAEVLSDGFVFLDVLPGAEIDQIRVDEDRTMSMQAGEIVFLMNTITGIKESVTLREDYNTGDELMLIEAHTFVEYFPARSYIFRDKTSILSPASFYRRYELLENQSGGFVTTTFDLPDVTTWTDAQIRERFQIYRSTAKVIYGLGVTSIDHTTNRIFFTPNLRNEIVEIQIM